MVAWWHDFGVGMKRCCRVCYGDAKAVACETFDEMGCNGRVGVQDLLKSWCDGVMV